MRPKPLERIESWRLSVGHFASTVADGCNGAFTGVGPTSAKLKIIASDGVDAPAEGWEHVSVSCYHRCPNWIEMCFVKNQFWLESECVVQFHPPESDYINRHPTCLHLWRHRTLPFPMPPLILI